MLRVFRVRAYCLATVLFLATGTVGASLDVLLHADASHADECLRVSVAHDAAAHRIQGASETTSTRDSHCVACHWARSLRLGPESASPADGPDEVGSLRTAQTIGSTRASARTHLQPRSPPHVA